MEVKKECDVKDFGLGNCSNMRPGVNEYEWMRGSVSE